ADTFEKLGFSSATELGLPAESRGIFRIPNKKQILEQATISYGHGISLTPLQIARAYSSLANGGYLVRPRLLKEDKVIKEQRVFSEKTTKTVTEMLLSSI